MKLRIGHATILQHGFTLLELLVAMSIFAMFATMAYGGLNAVVRQQELAGESMDRTREIQFAVRMLVNDLRQIHPRPIRDEIGDGQIEAVLADVRRQYALEFTHAGWGNPLGRPRGTLQRVAYRLEEGILVRSHWSALDRTLQEPPAELELLSEVEEVQLRFLDGNGDWGEQWPPLNDQSEQRLRLIPAAVEVIIELEDWGRISRLIDLAS